MNRTHHTGYALYIKSWNCSPVKFAFLTYTPYTFKDRNEVTTCCTEIMKSEYCAVYCKS